MADPLISRRWEYFERKWVAKENIWHKNAYFEGIGKNVCSLLSLGIEAKAIRRSIRLACRPAC